MKRSHFTLIELVTTIAIIAILTTMVIGGSKLASTKAAEAKNKALLQKLITGIEAYRQDRGYYPQSATAQRVGTVLASGTFKKTTENGGQPYIDGYTGGPYYDTYKNVYSGTPGNDFYYQCPGTMNPETFDLWSMGKDATHGEKGVNPSNDTDYNNFTDAQTTSENDDITNWKK